MSKVISGYFDDAHRGLQRQQSQGALPLPSSNVQLPPLRPDSGPAAIGGGGGLERDSWERGQASLGLHQSYSMGSLDYSRDQVTRGLQQDSYQQALLDNSKLARKVRQLQDQLAITSAKKDAFMAQAQRLEKEFKKGRDQSDTLQRELLEAKREAGQLTKEASEAIQMMSEMRKAHLHEVRLLQRGLAARSGDPTMRNKVNDVADLVDKVGRAVVQRDEALREKSKAQAQLNKAVSELRSLTEDCTRLKRQNRQLAEGLKEAKRKGSFRPRRSDSLAPDDSDEEFETELATFEKRFQILEEGPAGLDILASNLSKDKRELEKRLFAANESIKSLSGTVAEWKATCAEKDEQIRDLNAKLEQFMRNQARLEEQIAEKRREIELAVAAERARLEARIAELETDRDDARTLADGMEKASSALTRELVKVHESYARPVPGAAGGPGGQQQQQQQQQPGGAVRREDTGTASDKGELLASAEQVAKTGEKLKLEVYRKGKETELRAREVSAAPGGGEESRLALGDELLQELDREDPWTELLGRTGVDPGPPRRIVISSLIGQNEVSLPPARTSMLVTVFRYCASRYFVSALELSSGNLVEMAVLEGNITPQLKTRIASCRDSRDLFSVLAAGLAFEAKQSRLTFNAGAASRAP